MTYLQSSDRYINSQYLQLREGDTRDVLQIRYQSFTFINSRILEIKVCLVL